MSIPTVLLYIILMFLSIPWLQGFPTGAGNCMGGEASVGPAHLKGFAPTFNARVITGKIATGKFQVLLNSTVVRPVMKTSFKAGKRYIITLKSLNSNYFFRGFLLRLGTTTTRALLPAPGSRALVKSAAETCTDDGAVGLTHTSNVNKTSVSGFLLMPTAGNFSLDVTVVVRNSQHISQYYYTGFNLIFANY